MPSLLQKYINHCLKPLTTLQRILVDRSLGIRKCCLSSAGLGPSCCRGMRCNRGPIRCVCFLLRFIAQISFLVEMKHLPCRRAGGVQLGRAWHGAGAGLRYRRSARLVRPTNGAFILSSSSRSKVTSVARSHLHRSSSTRWKYCRSRRADPCELETYHNYLTFKSFDQTSSATYQMMTVLLKKSRRGH